jgi:hypothetical protein
MRVALHTRAHPHVRKCCVIVVIVLCMNQNSVGNWSHLRLDEGKTDKKKKKGFRL